MLTSRKKSKPEEKMLVKEVKPEAFRLLGDETRRKIMLLLKEKESNICAIADQLNITPQNVYHHVKKLEKGGLVHVTREERCGHLIESYYQATAENFCFSSDKKIEHEPSKEDLADVLNGLNEIGFKIEVNDSKASKLREFQKRRMSFMKLRSPGHVMCEKCNSADFFLKSGQIDPLTLDRIYHHANLIMMTDKEYEESIKLNRELREFLRSICKEKPKT